MPNNITHLPTNETLESGLSLIAQALDGDKISQISAKLSSQSKSLSEIDSFLAENLAGINTKLVSKGSTAASLYSEIPGKIEDIATGGSGFKLLPSATTISVTNKSFTLPYDGTLPADIQTGGRYMTFTTLYPHKDGVDENSAIVYVVSSVDTANKTITFTTSSADGVVTGAQSVLVEIRGQNGILSAERYSISGLPVDYEPRIVGIADVVITDRTEIAETEVSIVPTGVSPKAYLNIAEVYGTVFNEMDEFISSGATFELNKATEQDSADYYLTIPADTFSSSDESGYMFVSPASSTDPCNDAQNFKIGLTFED